jgi:hypothetical protein
VELVQEMADWLDAYYTRPNTCDEMLLKGIAAAQEELRMYIEEKASSGSTVLEIPHADIVPPTVVPIEPNNNTGLCGITHGLARQGEKGKVGISRVLLRAPCVLSRESEGEAGTTGAKRLQPTRMMPDRS